MKFIISLIVICIYQSLLSQNIVPYQDYKTTLWGLKDSKNNKTITLPKFNSISERTQGFLVLKGKKQGLYNPKGKEVLQPIFSSIKFTKNQQFIVNNDNKYGVVDSNFESIIPIQYDMIKKIDNHYYTVSENGLQGLMDQTGKLLIPIEYESFDAFYNGYSIAVKIKDEKKVYGVIHISNTEILPFIYPNIKTYKARYFYQIRERARTIKSNGEFNNTPSNHTDIGKIFNRKGEEINLEIYNIFHNKNSKFIKVSRKEEPTKYGFMDRFGRLKIPILYNYTTNFKESSAVVSIIKGSQTKFGIIDTLHNMYALGKYDYIGYPNNNTVIVYNGTYTKSGNKYVLKKGKYGLIDMKGNILIPVEYDVLTNLYNQTLFKTHKGNTDISGKPLNASFNIVNRSGSILNKQPYNDISYFKNGVSKVFIGQTTKGSYNKKIFDGKYGYIDTLGNEILPVEFDKIEEMNHAGFTVVMKKNKKTGLLKKGLINLKGEVVIPLQYDYFNDKSLAFIGTLDARGRPDKGKYGTINSSSGHYSKVIYDRIDQNIASYRVEDNNHIKDCYVLLRNGTETSAKTYDYMTRINKDFIKVFKVSEENNIQIGKYGIIDPYGKEIIPPIYTKIDLTDTHFKVRQIVDLDSKYRKTKIGLLNFEGKEIISPTYSNIYQFKNGVARVSDYTIKKQKIIYKKGLINLEGKEIIPLKYSDISRFDNEHQIALVFNGDSETEKGKYGYINRLGKEIIPLKYDLLSLPKDELILAKKKKKYGYINIHGEIVIPFIYTEASDFVNRKAKVQIKDKTFTINTQGEVE